MGCSWRERGWLLRFGGTAVNGEMGVVGGGSAVMVGVGGLSEPRITLIFADGL